MSAPVTSKISRSRIHYAWVVVAVTFATSVITAGTLGISGILLLPLQQGFGWNASDVSSPGITSTAQVSAPTSTTFCDASHEAADLLMPGSPPL